MDIAAVIDSGQPESATLEYTSEAADNNSILKEIVALANSEGGTIIVGIREQGGTIADVEDVSDPSGLEAALQNQLASNVEPRLDVEFIQHEYEGNQLIEISVPSAESLHSAHLSKPVFPVRRGSTTTYLHGLNLARAWLH